MRRRSQPLYLLLLTTPLLGGCNAAQLVETVTVMNERNCVNVQPGITASSLAAVRKLRQSRLLPPPDDAPLRPEDDLPALEDTRVYVFSKGQQPTPGYGLLLKQASLEGTTLTLAFDWQTPAPDAVLPQVLTHPCIAVGVPDTGATTLVAVDQYGEFARLDL